MKKTAYIMGTTLFLGALAVTAAQRLWLHGADGITRGMPAQWADSITNDDGLVRIRLLNADTCIEASAAETNFLTIADDGGEPEVVVTYAEGDAAVVNPLAYEGVEVRKDGAYVTVRSTFDGEVTYRLRGTCGDGQFKLYAAKKSTLVLDTLSLACGSGAAVNVQSGKKLTVVTHGTSALTDAKKYTRTPEGEDEKGCFFSEGQIIFAGPDTLDVTGLKKHAIVSDDYVSIEGGTVNVLSAVSDGIHANDYFTMKGGVYTSRATGGDGIDGDAGYIAISGGLLDIDVAASDTKGIKADSTITVTGGDIRLNVSGDQAKGISSKQDILLTAPASVTAITSGSVVVTDGDPSYCTAVKSKANIRIDGATVCVTSTSLAGKGISADSAVVITSGTFTMEMKGGAGTYTDAAGATDSYSSTCIKADGNLLVTGGTFDLTASGTAGKGISVDGDAVLGDNAGNGPQMTITTSGARLAEGNNQGGGGWWGGGRPGGPGDNTDYTNPKVVKAKGNLTVNAGTYTLRSTSDGGEGLESKKVLTVNGGIIDIETVDDCINAASQVVINGGHLRCVASGNDAIDSNGTLTVAGGYVVAMGTRSPECAFDCDQNRFAVTGGTFIGLGGDTSTPTASACTQRVVVYRGLSLGAGQKMTVTDAAGRNILSFDCPSGYTAGSTAVFSSPAIAAGTQYAVKTGCNVSGAEAWRELSWGGTASGGTTKTTFTPSSMVTSIGSGGGGRF